MNPTSVLSENIEAFTNSVIAHLSAAEYKATRRASWGWRDLQNEKQAKLQTLREAIVPFQEAYQAYSEQMGNLATYRAANKLVALWSESTRIPVPYPTFPKAGLRFDEAFSDLVAVIKKVGQRFPGFKTDEFTEKMKAYRDEVHDLALLKANQDHLDEYLQKLMQNFQTTRDAYDFRLQPALSELSNEFDDLMRRQHLLPTSAEIPDAPTGPKRKKPSQGPFGWLSSLWKGFRNFLKALVPSFIKRWIPSSGEAHRSSLGSENGMGDDPDWAASSHHFNRNAAPPTFSPHSAMKRNPVVSAPLGAREGPSLEKDPDASFFGATMRGSQITKNKRSSMR